MTKHLLVKPELYSYLDQFATKVRLRPNKSVMRWHLSDDDCERGNIPTSFINDKFNNCEGRECKNQEDVPLASNYQSGSHCGLACTANCAHSAAYPGGGFCRQTCEKPGGVIILFESHILELLTILHILQYNSFATP